MININVVIRADGGKNMGMGHITRSSVLAKKIKDYADVTYVCLDEEELLAGISYLESNDFRVITTSKSQLVDCLETAKGDCLITDSYNVDERYFDVTKKFFRKTGYIDDLNQMAFNVDFLINQNIYANDFKYKVNTDTQLLLGTEYVMIRDEFSDLSKREIKREIKDMLITIGGAPDSKLLISIINQINKNYPHMNIHIPTGLLDNNIGNDNSNKIYYHRNAKMSELMYKCDIAISACGTTIYELMACGTPTIGVVLAQNQVQSAKKLNELGYIKLAHNNECISKIINNMKYEVRKDLSRKQKKLVDGQGSSRLVYNIKNLLEE